MEMMLAENIRMYRKRKRLTQEQLADDLGVTSGAVYKWEAKLSVPELNMIIVIADYFDTSVDALYNEGQQIICYSSALKRIPNQERIYRARGSGKSIKEIPSRF